MEDKTAFIHRTEAFWGRTWYFDRQNVFWVIKVSIPWPTLKSASYCSANSHKVQVQGMGGPEQ